MQSKTFDFSFSIFVPRLRFSPHLFIILAFATLLAAPLTAPGYFIFAHDARHTVYFMQMFDADLRDGALLPRWATDMVFGYGYPVWLILAPLPYYAAEVFHLIGLDFPSSIKAVETLAWFVSALGMYGFISHIMGKDAGLVAALAYLFVPYHIVDLYVRGAMAEFLAFVFPPFILWMIYEIFAARRAIYVPLAALAYAALILTHISMAVLFSPVIAGYILVLWLRLPVEDGRRTTDDGDASSRTMPEPREMRDDVSRPPSAVRPHPSFVGSLPRALDCGFLLRIAPKIAIPSRGHPSFLAILSLLWGIGISAVFLLPILAEQRYLTSDPLIGGFFDFRLHFVNPSQLISPFWGYGYAGVNGADQFSLQLGILPLFFGVIALLSLKRDEPVSAQIIYFALVLAVAVLAMLSITTPLWELAAPIIAFTQFPWRLLFVTAFALAVLAGASIRAIADRYGESSTQLRAAFLFSFLLAFALFPVAHPQYTDAQFTWNTMMDFQVKDRELLGDTVWTQQRPQDSPLVAQYRAGNITTKAVIVEGQGDVQLLERRPLGDTIRVNAATPARVMFYTRYFPGWTATLDGAPIPIEPSGEQGLITLNVPPGSHVVTTHWGTTPPRIIGAIISLLSLLVAIVWIVGKRQMHCRFLLR